MSSTSRKLALWGVALAVACGLAPAALAETPGDVAMIVTGSRKDNGEVLVRVRVDLDGNAVYETLGTSFNPFPGARITDGVRVATGVFGGDTAERLVTGAGTGQPVKIFELNSNGTVGNLIESRKLFRLPRRVVAAGDVNNDGRAELIVGAGRGRRTSRSTRTPIWRRVARQSGGFVPCLPLGFPGRGAGRRRQHEQHGRRRGDHRLGLRRPADQDLDRCRPRRSRVGRPRPRGGHGVLQLFKGGVNVATGEIVSIGGPGAELDDRPRRRQGEADPHAHGRGRQGALQQPAFYPSYPYGSGWNKGVRVAAGDTDHSGFFVELATAPGGSRAARRSGSTTTATTPAPSCTTTRSRRSSGPCPAPSVPARTCCRPCLRRHDMSLQAPRAIPDGGTATSDVLVPASAGRIQSMSVALNIPHTFAADLDVTLTHMASGTSLSLFSDVGDVANGFLVAGRLLPDRHRDVRAREHQRLDAGAFNPKGAAALTTFNRIDASGAWRLTVTDDALMDTGVIRPGA